MWYCMTEDDDGPCGTQIELHSHEGATDFVCGHGAGRLDFDGPW